MTEQQQEEPVENEPNTNCSNTLPPPSSSITTGKSNKPPDTAFRQQRLPAWRPILTPQNVIPILFCIACIFIPLGVVFLSSSKNVQEYTFNYTDCIDKATPVFTKATYKNSHKDSPFKWRIVKDEGETSINDKGNQCEILFKINKKMSNPVFLYYRLTNFYQNNRLYVKSVSNDQLKGKAVERSKLDECKPLVGPKDSSSKVYYPCGLIANSYFSDTYGGMKNTNTDDDVIYFVPKGITWSSDRERYGKTDYKLSQIAPPPFWTKNRELVDENGDYKEIPRIWLDERFQVWMRVAALPTFIKPYGKYDFDVPAGEYTMVIDMNYDVKSYSGTKSIVISTVSWIGGQNEFLGIAYLVVGGICALLGLVFLLKHMISPRKLGDHRYLSWNKEMQK